MQKLPDEFRKLLGVEEKQEQRRMDSKRIWKARENQKRYWLCILPQSGHWSPLVICSKISAGTIDDPTPVAASLQGWALSYQLPYGFPAKLFWVLFQIIYLAHGWGDTLNDILRCFPTHIHLWLGFCELATFPPALYWHILKCMEFSRALATVVTKPSLSVAMQQTRGKIQTDQ